MSALEKLVKALEALKFIHSSSSSSSEETPLRCKEKVGLCVLVADMICSPETRAAPNFASLLSYSMETLLQMCDDQDSNIRMNADECLNRIIRAMMDNNIVKVHVELHKEIKKNGSARSLRAALWRFAELAHLIKPHKGKPYIQSLVPSLINIAKRKEESVLETLAAAIPKIFSILGNFTTDNDIRKLLQVFLRNINSEHAVVRRTAATSIISICLHCPKTQFFLVHTLNTLLEMVIPVKNDQCTYTILGVLNCIRGLLGHLNCEGKETVIRGSFGVKRKHNRQATLSVDTTVQVYELCLHWTHHSDHNIVTAALETLNQLLTTPPPQLVSVLLSSQGLTRSRIQAPSSAKLSNRTLSDMSVASTVPLMDDSSILEADETSSISNFNQWLPEGSLNNAFGELTSADAGNTSMSSVIATTEEGDTESESYGSEDADALLKCAMTVPSPEPDIALATRDSPSPPPVGQQNMQIIWDIGDITDTSQCTLIYCSRRLVTAFLIPDCTSVRVSVRALAIGCLSQVLRLYPQAFAATIDKNGLSTPQGFSHISDVLCFSSHSDQQLRGLIRLLIGYLIQAKLDNGWENVNTFSESGKRHSDKTVTLETLVHLLIEGLNDESSVCIRHTLGALSVCLSSILESTYNSVCCPLLEKLILLSSNPYWLVKVKLAELMCSLSYQSIYYITKDNNYQNRVIKSVVLVLLSDQDNRVRKAASEGICRLVDNLYFQVDYGQDDIAVARGTYISRKLFADTFKIEEGEHSGPLVGCFESMIENTLSRVIQILSQSLLESSSKYLTYGCIEALSLLSVKYPTTSYPMGWQCQLVSCEGNQTSASNGMLAITLALLTASPASLDLEAHQWLLNLAGNLFSGLSKCYVLQSENNAESSCQMWSAISDKKLATIAENLLQHVMRLMYIFVRILEDVSHTRNIGSSPLKRRPTRGTSPCKQTSTPEKEGFKEEKGRAFGYFSHIPHCVKLYEIIRSAYNNYRITLDSGASEKFLCLIHCVLSCLEKLLCQAGAIETGRIAEEILQYLRVTFILDSTATVKVVNQLLKSLFESNFGQSQDSSNNNTHTVLQHVPPTCGFYSNVLLKPLENLVFHLDTNVRSPFEYGKGSGKSGPSETFKTQSRPFDREALAANIKLFEPIVIQALKEYTTTSNVRLQVQVLRLLTQLVQLKVNYCLLDSDQIFIKFVLKQFEYLEEGQIHHAELLIPQIFKFLVYLSNEKNHSKPVISVPKVIQLCDGLMASGQNPVTHCIPALIPVVEHVFLLNSSATCDIKELEAQREVLLAMLLRLAEYPEVIKILYKVMKEGWRWEEHWKRWYRQTTETILPLLTDARLLVDNCSVLHGLLNLNSCFTTPVNSLLLRLFTPQQEGQLTVHWLGMVTTMMLSVCTYKEERILLELEQLNLYVREEGDDPLNVKTISKTLPPQSLMAKLILRVLKASITKLSCLKGVINDAENFDCFQNLLANFMLCSVFMSQPGNFEKVTKSLKELLINSSDLKDLNQSFIHISGKCPLLTILWGYLLVLLDQGDKQLWVSFMKKGTNNKSKPISVGQSSLNLEVVQRGSILLYCEYLSKNPSDLQHLKWFLEDYVCELVWNCQEAPVEKLLCSVYYLESNSKMLLDALSRCTSICQPVFTHRLLHTLEYIHSNYTGCVLRLVSTSLIEHRNIALARLASAFCTRILEYMLTLDQASVLNQLTHSQLLDLLKSLTENQKLSKRHNGLISLLNKLGSQFYGISPCELKFGKLLNTAHIRSITLDRAWLLSQVKDKCCIGADVNGKMCARLLSELDPEDIAAVLSCPEFDTRILKQCFILGTKMTLEAALKSQVNNPHEAPLYSCALTTLLCLVNKLCTSLPSEYQIYSQSSCIVSGEIQRKTEMLSELFCKFEFRQLISPLVPAVTVCLCSASYLSKEHGELLSNFTKESRNNLTQFGVLCLEMAHWLILKSSSNNIKSWPSLLHNLLECAAVIFQFDVLSSLLSYKQIASIGNAICCILKIVKGEEIGLKTLKYKTEEMTEEYQMVVDSCLLMASLISWLENHLEEGYDIPAHMYHCTRSVIVSIGRNQKINWFCRTPVEAWQIPVNVDCPPPLPMHLLHDADILRQIVLRISLIGWSDRLQFEETWVCLLSALSPNPDIDATDQEEISVIMQANSIAVDGITWLVLSTLATNAENPNVSSLLHIPRHENTNLYKLSYWKKLKEINESLCWKLKRIGSDNGIELTRIDKRPNIERGNDTSGYSFGQLSVLYLQTQITPPEERSPGDAAMNMICAERENRLSSSGIDIRSCTQFLLDLFSQWTLPNSGISLNLQLSMVKSVLSLSDMFTERSHFIWMLNTLLDLSKNHPQHDEVLHQYLVIGVCKAAAVLNNFEGEISDKVMKILEGSLKNQFPPIRSAGIHGLLYLLQSVQKIKKPEPSADNIQKLGAQDFRQKIMQVTIEYTQKYCTGDSAETADDVLLGVALLIYLLEYFPDELPNTQTIMKYLSQLIKNSKNNKCYQAVMQGLERVVLCGRTDLNEQITRLALDRFSQSDPCITLPGLQVLVACIYSGQHLSSILSGNTDRSAWTMEIMEKTTALFDRIKKGYPVEVELVCEILPRILADFFPASDILTKVIGEFLSPNQPHKRNMAAMVFQVFTQACSEQQLPLLQDWVVHSLSNFTSNLPVAVWSLCCFFISASANPWLRAIFPHVQSRIRQCDYEDRKILCIAAVDFYRQLGDKQKEIFLQSFKETSSNQKSPFADIIACL